MFFWRQLGPLFLWWELTDAPGPQLGQAEWHVHLWRLPACLAFCRCQWRMWVSSQRSKETRGFAKFRECRQASSSLCCNSLRTRRDVRDRALSRVDLRRQMCPASNRLDDLNQTSHHLSPGLSFPLCKMRPLGPSPNDLWFCGHTSEVFIFFALSL